MTDGTQQQLKKRKAREEVNILARQVCKKYGIEDILDKDPKLKKKLMLDV